MSDKTVPIDLAQVREEYERLELRRHDLHDEPTDQLATWMQEALRSGADEPTAMSLATVGPDGMPTLRVVLLKGLDVHGLRFFTNYRSQKGRHLEAEPRAACCFFWPSLSRQARVEGSVEKLDRQDSEEYFHSRPHASQLGAWCSPQSQVVADRAELESRLREAENRFAGREVDLPETWGGYRLVPSSFEFWQGRHSRLHDRFRYRRPAAGNGWKIERLAP